MVVKYEFENLQNHNEFELIEIYRDKTKTSPKTIWKFKCRRCGCVLLKEQTLLFLKRKRIVCFDCENRKQPGIITKNIIIAELLKFDAKLIELSKTPQSINKVTFECKCGNVAIKEFGRNKHWKCGVCTMAARVLPNQKNVDDFRTDIIKFGCEPLFEKNEYINSNSILPIRCVCGNVFTTRYSRFNPKFKLRCPTCMHIDWSGPNHWNWTGGLTKRSLSENGWKRKIKQKFNNKCCISNATSLNSKLVVHHLDAAASNIDKQLDINNGVCITESLHMEFHKKYDSYCGTCTRYDFFEFFKDKTGTTFDEYLYNNNINLII